jgi:hypothetical protein
LFSFPQLVWLFAACFRKPRTKNEKLSPTFSKPTDKLIQIYQTSRIIADLENSLIEKKRQT